MIKQFSEYITLYKNSFSIAYKLNTEKNTAERIFRYTDGLIEKKKSDGTWETANEQLCIFYNEDIKFTEITLEQASNIQLV